MKKIYSLLLIGLLFVTGCNVKKESDQINIVSTIFPGYDFARAVGKENVNLTMLVKPGSDSHSYDPSPKDIIKIEESDLFIYVGGESEEWVDSILKNLSSKTKVIRLMDLVEVKEEEIIEGMEEETEEEDGEEHDEEYDEHIWTSPMNAITMVSKIKDVLVNIDLDNSKYYEDNATDYIEKLNQLDIDIKKTINEGHEKTLVFADRFPFRYFVDEYNLDYKAAFPGCSHDTEASSKTITYLINYVKDNNIPVVFYIELSNQKLADTLVDETKIQKLEFQSAHNLTRNDFDKGVTYIDIMKQNILNLKEALK